MQPKRSKYDTNPLDERVGERASDSFGSVPASQTEGIGGPTRGIAEKANETSRAQTDSEAPTRLIGDEVTSYPSIFVPPQREKTAFYEPPKFEPAKIYQPPPLAPASVYQPPPAPVTYKAGSNKVTGLGIPERWAVILPYLPVYLAIVVGIVELVLVPRTETRTRFHASQALALQIGITAVSMLLTFAGIFSERFTGAGLFNLASGIFLVIAMVRVWKGKPFVIPPVDEPRKWLDEKIKPRK